METISTGAPPPPFFLDTAQRVALALGLDVDAATQGRDLEYDAVRFRLCHHGDLDPSAVVLAMHIESQGDMGIDMLKALLRHNCMVPAAISGYFGLLPASDALVHCVRADGETAAARIVTCLHVAVSSRRKLTQAFQDAAMRDRASCDEASMARARAAPSARCRS